MKTKNSDYFNQFSMPVGQTFCWYFDSLTLAITRQEHEYIIRYQYSNEINEGAGFVPHVNTTFDEVIDFKNSFRIMSGKTQGIVEIKPLMADRSLVARPFDPVVIFPGCKTNLYVGVPIWTSVFLDGNKKAVLDIPIRQITSTWFGPSPRKGELCYGSRTNAFSELNEVPNRYYRATVPVQLENRHKSSTLKVERINIPLSYLDLYESESGLFWTQGLTMIREDDDNDTKVKLSVATIPEAGNVIKISESRKKASSNLLNKTVEMLFA